MIYKILFFYAFILLLPLIAPINVSAIYFVIGQVLTILFFVIFYFGWIAFGKQKSKNTHEAISNNLIKRLRLLCILTPFFAVYAVNFYTGSGPLEVFGRLLDGVSSYIAYQIFFQESISHKLAHERFLGIASLAIVKFALISYVILLKYTNETSKVKYYYLTVAVLSYLYIGLGRGTSKEIFEVIMLYIFVANLSPSSILKSKKVKDLIILGSFISLAVLIFYGNISLRGEINCINNQICYESNFLSHLSSSLSSLSYILFAYFSFGLFYTHFAINLMAESSFSLISYFTPFAPFFLVDSNDFRSLVCQDIDCGVLWRPASIDMILLMGFAATFAAIFILGLIARFMTGGVWGDGIKYIIFLYMVSLPFGNIVIVSSSTLISLLMFTMLYACNRFKIKAY